MDTFVNMEIEPNHSHFMKLALKEAWEAFDKDEVPVGAIVVSEGKIIGRGHNLTKALRDVTAHAEMQAITAAAIHLGGNYLKNCTLYVTLEPCLMCAGAIAWAQVGTLVFGAYDQKKGYKKINQPVLHPKTKVISGILEKECSQILIDFFLEKRKF